MDSDPDAIVIGAGPNGLIAACRLARSGLRVLVLEANDRPGGALWSDERTEPGFHHDVGAGFVAFRDSDAFESLALSHRGLDWALAPVESAHPAPDGTCPVIRREPDRAPEDFGTTADGEAWRSLAVWHRRIEPAMLKFMGPFPSVSGALALGPVDGVRLASLFVRSGAGLARHLFDSEAARRVIPAMGLHVDVGPENPMGAGISYVLALRASTSGFAVPVGGAASITRALVADLEAHGGRLQLGATVDRILVRRGRAHGVVLRDGQTVQSRHAVVANTSAAMLYMVLLERAWVPGRIVSAMRRFPQGWGTFKLDFALDGPVPWTAAPCHDAAVVHVGDSLDDLQRFTLQVRAGALPDHPYLVVGQQSVADPTRAPDGKHTLYVYTHVPSHLDSVRYPGGWPQWRDHMADIVQARIEGLAPGFGAQIRARTIADPGDLQRMSANLAGGDLGGGSNQWHRQLVFRPVFPHFRHRTPVSGVYLSSSYTHPGAGVHGMCGWNAAGAVLSDL